MTRNFDALAALCAKKNQIDPTLYAANNVQRGLRDKEGNGVKAGLTQISTITSFKTINGEKLPCQGVLRYRGIDVKQLCDGFLSAGRYGFEEVAYLLLFGDLPDGAALGSFHELLAQMRQLPAHFVRDVIMKAPRQDMMNLLSRSVLTIGAYDRQCDDVSIPNVLRQCLHLTSIFPLLAVYGYHCYNHYECDDSLYIHRADPLLSTAENVLRLLRPDKTYTPLEAKILDLALVLHMEHGGGNNSTFTTHVVSSSGTDTYSTIASALGSLKGPKHGGANIKVVQMFEDLKRNVGDLKDEDEVRAYLEKLLAKETFDQKGLIYGMGHAVYSLSDPRADLFKQFTEQLANEKGEHDEFALYDMVERIAPQVIAKKRRIYKGVSANVDFYSGFVYRILGIPAELYTPMFAIARIVGWSAHRLEELINQDKIIRPAYQSVLPPQEYIAMEDRS
ncbi:MAG: citrate/2-methylcitrate synthase [Oscillospiraceae bacterium]|jgi:citrate synthase|nr:citrate/2-methylcitrate synthase [Oscillospiraceae bacterium]